MGQEIYTENEGNGKTKLYIEKVLEGLMYTLRRGDKKGEEVVKEKVSTRGDTEGEEENKVFTEEQLRPKPFD